MDLDALGIGVAVAAQFRGIKKWIPGMANSW
jgi:hypothetical protein